MGAEVEELRADMRELAGHVRTLAKAVYDNPDTGSRKRKPVRKAGRYRKAEGDYPGEDRDYMDPDHPDMDEGMMDDDDDYGQEFEHKARRNKAGEEDLMGDLEDEMGEYGEEDEDVLPEEHDYDEAEMEMAYKALRKAQRAIAKARKRNKGFASRSQVKSDEHDAPFDEKDSSIDGNEEQPAGAQGGDREDESFGPGGNSLRPKGGGTYKALVREVAQLRKELKGNSGDEGEGQVIAKAQAPAGTGNSKQGGGEEPILTREMQEQFKTLSWGQINKFREEVGDLPKHLF